MEKFNLPPFTIGQAVVCVDDSETWGIKKGDKYTVTGFVNNCRCGLTICVNNIPNISQSGNPIKQGQLVHCPTCNTTIYASALKSYLPRRFAPLQEQKFKAVTFEKLCEEVELICEN